MEDEDERMKTVTFSTEELMESSIKLRDSRRARTQLQWPAMNKQQRIELQILQWLGLEEGEGYVQGELVLVGASYLD